MTRTISQRWFGRLVPASSRYRPRLDRLEDRLSPAVITWVNPGDGNWEAANNWDLGRVPDAADDARILTAGITVTHRTGVRAVRSLVSNASVNLVGGTLTFGTGLASTINAAFNVGPNGTLSWLGAVFEGTGALVNQGTMLVRGNSTLRLPFATGAASTLRVEGADQAAFTSFLIESSFTNNGRIELTNIAAVARNVSLTSHGTLVNAAGGTIRATTGTPGGVRTLVGQLDNRGTFIVDGILVLGGLSPAHVNSGTFTIAGGELTVNLLTATPGSFSNQGTINVTGGDLIFNLSGFRATAVNAGTINVTAGRSFLVAGTVLNESRFDPRTGITGQAVFRNVVVGGGTVGLSSTFILEGCAVAVDATLVNEGTLAARQGNQVLGTLRNNAGAMLRVESTQALPSGSLDVRNGFVNNGTVEFASGDGVPGSATLSASNGTVTNAAGAVINVPARAPVGSYHLNASLDNQGTLNVDANLTMTRTPAAHVSRGTVAVRGGDLTVVGDSPNNDTFTNLGIITVSAGRTFTVRRGRLNYTGGAIGGPGTLALREATWNLGVNFSNAVTALSLSTVSVQGTGTLTNATDRTLTFAGVNVGTPLVNQGTLVFADGGSLGGPFSNPAGATLRLEATPTGPNPRLQIQNGFTNFGTIELLNRAPGARQLTLEVTNGSLVNAPGATLHMPAAVAGDSCVLEASLDNQGTLRILTNVTLRPGAAGGRNGGAIEVTGGNLTVANSLTNSFTTTGTITVGAGRTLTFRDGHFHYTAGGIAGAGTFALSNAFLNLGPEITLSSSQVGLALDSSTINGPGTLVNAAGRTLVLLRINVNAPLVHQGGELILENSSVSSPLFNPSRVVARGASFLNGAFTTAAASVLRLEGTSTSLTVRDGFTNLGTIEMDASQGFNHILNVTNGTLVNAEGAVIHTLPGGSPQLAHGLNAHLDNRGTVRVRKWLNLNRSGVTHVNGPTGTILAEHGLSVGGAAIFLNQGTFRKTGGVLEEGIFASFLNTGVVELQGATLPLFSNGSNDGRITVGEGGRLIVGSFTQTANGSLTGGGIVEFDFGTSPVAGTYQIGTTRLTRGSATFNAADAQTVELRVSAEAAAALLIPAAGALTVLGDFILSSGTTNVDGALLVVGQMDIRFGSFNVRGGGQAYAGGGVLTLGNVSVRDGGLLQTAGAFTQTGGMTFLQNGFLSAALVDLQRGNLSGTGTITGDVVNAGQLIVGGVRATGGLYIAGNYAQTETGQLTIELGGLTPEAEYDFLSVDGLATLDGVLNVTLINGYRPEVEDTFGFLRFNGSSGDFAAFNGLDLGDGRALFPIFDEFGYYLWTYEV